MQRCAFFVHSLLIFVDRGDLVYQLLEHVEDYPHRVERGEGRHAVVNGTASELLAALIVYPREDGSGVDDIADVTRADGVEGLFAALVDIGELLDPYPVRPEEIRRAGGGLNIEAYVAKSLNEGQSLLLILVRDGHEHRAVIEHRYARGLQRFVERPVEPLVVANRFAC